MKKFTLFAAVLLCLILYTACGKTYTAEDVAGKVYTYEKDGCGGYFTISIFEDGTFQYYEGMLSSYIGMGAWTLDENGILCMKDQEMGRFTEDMTMEMYVRTNYFKVEKNCLVWLGQGSDNFLYVDVADGDRFFGETLRDSLSNLNFSSYFGGSEQTKYLVSLDEVRDLVLNHNCTEARLKELLDGFTHEDLTTTWGQWDGMTSGLWSYSWNLGETGRIGVFFDSNGYVEDIRISR